MMAPAPHGSSARGSVAGTEPAFSIASAERRIFVHALGMQRLWPFCIMPNGGKSKPVSTRDFDRGSAFAMLTTEDLRTADYNADLSSLELALADICYNPAPDHIPDSVQSFDSSVPSYHFKINAATFRNVAKQTRDGVLETLSVIRVELEAESAPYLLIVYAE